MTGMTTVFIATGNAHKVEEIRSVLGGSGRVFLSQQDASVRLEPEETGSTFRENARIKSLTWATFLAMEVCHLGAQWVLADDSGLEVDALRARPEFTRPVLLRWTRVERATHPTPKTMPSSCACWPRSPRSAGRPGSGVRWP